MAMGCRQCLPLSVIQLGCKHCQKPHCRNGVVDTFGLCHIFETHIWDAFSPRYPSFSWFIPLLTQVLVNFLALNISYSYSHSSTAHSRKGFITLWLIRAKAQKGKGGNLNDYVRKRKKTFFPPKYIFAEPCCYSCKM